MFYNSVDGTADTINIDFSMPSINTDVSFITNSTAIMINALLNQAINLDVVQSKQTLKVWKSTMDIDRVINTLQVVITSENGENRNTVILQITSPLPNVCEITDIEPNPDRPWEKIDITIDNSEQDDEDSRTDGVLLLRSSDSTDLYNFTPEDGNRDANVHSIGEINTSGIFIVSDLFNVSNSYTFIDDGGNNFDPGKKYYYRLIPYAYNNDVDKHPWYSKIVKMKSTKTKRVKCVFEFRQFKIIDEADGAGTCEIETKVCVNGSQKWSNRYENLEDNDIRGSGSSPLYEGIYYLNRDERIIAEMELKEDDGDNSSDDYIFWGAGCGLNIFDYYQDDIGDAALGNKEWSKCNSVDPGAYYTRYHETKTDDATVEVWLYMFADIVD